jgi:hypothetical protein
MTSIRPETIRIKWIDTMCEFSVALRFAQGSSFFSAYPQFPRKLGHCGLKSVARRCAPGSQKCIWSPERSGGRLIKANSDRALARELWENAKNNLIKENDNNSNKN